MKVVVVRVNLRSGAVVSSAPQFVRLRYHANTMAAVRKINVDSQLQRREIECSRIWLLILLSSNAPTSNAMQYTECFERLSVKVTTHCLESFVKQLR